METESSGFHWVSSQLWDLVCGLSQIENRSWSKIICSYYHGKQTAVLVKPTTRAWISHSIDISVDKQKYEY